MCSLGASNNEMPRGGYLISAAMLQNRQFSEQNSILLNHHLQYIFCVHVYLNKKKRLSYFFTKPMYENKLMFYEISVILHLCRIIHVR
jgi:hypothetical protein